MFLSLKPLPIVLDNWGFRVSKHGQSVTVPGSGEKVNLIAERGQGSRCLVFSGHLDTVPVGDTSLWTHDPYGSDGIVDGRIYGRGSNDMKGQIAAAAVAAASVPEQDLQNTRVVLALTSDEEVGHYGIKALCSRYRFTNCVGVVVAEPTNMDVVTAHKGGVVISVAVRGISCHSSRPDAGVNAITQAMRFIQRLQDNLEEWGAYRHPAFGDEPQTFTVAQIHGGVADNIVPAECTVRASGRVLSQDQLDKLRGKVEATISELQTEDRNAGISEDRIFNAAPTVNIWAPPMVTSTDEPWAQNVMKLRGQNEPLFVRYGTDGGVLSATGLPCVIWGPGDIGRAHVPDEYITVDELRDGTAWYQKLIETANSHKLPASDSSLWTEEE